MSKPNEVTASASAPRWASWARTAPELLPGALAVFVFVTWAAAGGGFSVVAQGIGGLFLLGLLATIGYAYRDAVGGLNRPTRLAGILLAAFVVWNFVSISWADVPADAWEGANRSLIYFCAFAVFAIPAWSGQTALLVTGAWGMGCAVVGVLAVAQAAASTEPILSFVVRRFADPTGYHNASAALFTAALFPPLVIASRREVHPALRGLMLATTQTLFLLALLPQSRGWLIAAPVAAALALLVTPGRGRLVIFTLPLIATSALCAGSILDVFTAANEQGDLNAALDAALVAIALGAIAAFLAGTALAVVDMRLEFGERASRFGRRGGAAALVVAAAAGFIFAISATGNPVSWAEDRWNDFKSGEPEQGFDDSRLGGTLGSNRYDFWRVALESGMERPLIGLGAENFAVDYARERKSDEEPLHPHSLPVRILSQTGLIGGVLFLSFIASAAFAAAVARRRGPPVAQAAAAACVVSFVYWLVHSSGDWFWALPALSAPAFAWLGLAGAIGRQTHNRAEGSVGRDHSRQRTTSFSSTRWRRALAAGGVAPILCFGVLSFSLPGLAARDIDVAARSWSSDSGAAYERLDRAASLNFLSAQPALVQGAIASRLGDFERMREAFSQALQREPQAWYPRLELGALDSVERNFPAAIATLKEAVGLNPRDPTIKLTLRRARDRRPLPLARIDASFLERVCLRLGATKATDYCSR